MTVNKWSYRASIRRALIAAYCLFLTWNPLIGSASPPTALATAGKLSEVREFDILVDGKVAGTHRLSIASEGDVTTTRVESDVKIDFVVYTYTYKFRATEIWSADGLSQIDARSEDGGKKTSITAKTDGAKCQVVLNGRQSVTDRSTITTCYWQLPSKVDEKRTVTILDVEKGITKPGTIEHIGPAKLKLGDNPVSCRHYKVSGISPADLWFDDQDRLVCQKSVEDGHPTELRLKRIRQRNPE